MQHLIDKPIVLGECIRCGGHVFACTASGIAAAADPEPLDATALRAALRGGRDVFRVISVAGHPHKLQRAGESLLRNLDHHTFVAGHTCGAAAMDTTRVDIKPLPPPPSPCDAWRAQGWQPPRQCPRRHTGLLQGDAEGVPVSCRACDPPPFDVLCEDCKLSVFNNQLHWAIQVGDMKWAMHDECRDKPIWS